MDFPKRYEAHASERRWQEEWAAHDLYRFNPADPRPIYSIDTPPPTVSGKLHMGHIYSYTQAEAVARFWRMRGFNIYYPFGFDDNGLPTERFVEKRLGKSARQLGRGAFIDACLAISRETEDQFEALWRSLGFSVDWTLRYSTIDDRARRLSQWSFLDLYHKGRIYRSTLPNPWCPECQTAVAQAEMDDAERETTFYTLEFGWWMVNGVPADVGASGQSTIHHPPSTIPIATTRPELLPACVAVFMHPDDARYAGLIGQEAELPLFGRRVPILADRLVDPAKGSGAVMCCTFGDATDVLWWREHQLPLTPLLRRNGTLGPEGGPYAGLSLAEARTQIVADLAGAGLLLDRRPAPQSVRVHERCGTPLEILETSQWFVRLLDEKETLLALGRSISWHPAHMHARYEHWVQNLSWDWCISRQRPFGVPFPAWHCAQCGGVLLADEAQLPCDPLRDPAPGPCPTCGSSHLRPDEDVMDTWATSSISPQIAAGRAAPDEQVPTVGDELRAALPALPMALRPQAHDIIRTWAFYTIVKSYYHFEQIPWREILISGHGLSAGGEKVSKSKLNADSDPSEVIAKYGADAVRYWACDGAPGSDQIISEDRMRDGQRLLNKLWSAARFVAGAGDRGLGIGDKGQGTRDKGQGTGDWGQGTRDKGLGTGDKGQETRNSSPHRQSPIPNPQSPIPSPIDRALLSRLDRLVAEATVAFERYDYARAKALTERFFWADLCDSYLELIKGRLYDGDAASGAAALATLRSALATVLKLFAPVLPHITEELHTQLFAAEEPGSIHTAPWPASAPTRRDEAAEQAWEVTMALVEAVRRHKSAQHQSLGTPFQRLHIRAAAEGLAARITGCADELRSATRASTITIATGRPDERAGWQEAAEGLWLLVEG